MQEHFWITINNPFSTHMTVNNISTGAEIHQSIVDGLIHCLEIGEKSYQDFVQRRFQNKEKNLHYTIPTNRKTVFAKHSRSPQLRNRPQQKMQGRPLGTLTMPGKEDTACYNFLSMN